MRILLVEDDLKLAPFILKGLKEAGFAEEVDLASMIRRACELFQPIAENNSVTMTPDALTWRG